MSTPTGAGPDPTQLDTDVDGAAATVTDDLRDTGADTTGTGGRTELPLEADPADVAEQDAAVPFDEER